MTTIDLSQAADFFDEKRFRAAALRGVRRAAVRSLQIVTTKIIPSRVPQPVDRGVYRASWKTQMIPNGAEVYTDAPQAPFIENEVRAENVKIGRLMIIALREWVKRHGLAETPEKARVIAYAIARSMQERGIFNKGSRDGLPGLGIMRELVRFYLPTLIREEVERSIEREIQKGGS